MTGLLPSSVEGTAQLRLFRDGFWRYEGHVHENGPEEVES